MRSLATQINWCRRLQWGLSVGLAVVVVLFVVAGYFPARFAMRVEPQLALRHE